MNAAALDIGINCDFRSLRLCTFASLRFLRYNAKGIISVVTSFVLLYIRLPQKPTIPILPGAIIIAIAISLSLSPAATAGEWHGSGTPLYTIAEGSLHGGVYVGGGHGLTYSDPYVEYFDLPNNIIYARLYVPMWNYNDGDTLTVSINEDELATRGEPDYIAAWGISCYAYDVSGAALVVGVNKVSATYENNNGAPYAIFLVAVYENQSMPYTQFWIDEGNHALSKAVADGSIINQGVAPFSGDVDNATVERADLWTVIIAGTDGEEDELWFNSKLIGTDVGKAKTGSYLDFDNFTVTDSIVSHNNTAIFKRGGEQYIHPFNAIFAVVHEKNVTGDTKLTVFETQSSRGPAIPIPVVAVLVISLIALLLVYAKKRRGRG